MKILKNIWYSMLYIYGMPLVAILGIFGAKQKADKLFNWLEVHCL